MATKSDSSAPLCSPPLITGHHNARVSIATAGPSHPPLPHTVLSHHLQASGLLAPPPDPEHPILSSRHQALSLRSPPLGTTSTLQSPWPSQPLYQSVRPPIWGSLFLPHCWSCSLSSQGCWSCFPLASGGAESGSSLLHTPPNQPVTGLLVTRLLENQ